MQMQTPSTGVDGLLNKIAESEGLRADAGVLDQGTEQTIQGAVPFLLGGVGSRNDREEGTTLEATKTIEDLLQLGEKFFFFWAKLLTFQKFNGNEANYNS